MAEIYCRPVYERGTGLGNRLFPWARCVIFARRHGATMIDPVWSRLAVGQLFRGGIDYRSYLRQLVLFRLFRGHPHHLSPLSGFWRGRGLPAVAESSAAASVLAATPAADGETLILFKGLGNFFAPLIGHHALLLDELRAITRPRYLRVADAIGEVPIAVCVRCGNDYREPRSTTYGLLGPADKTPLKWYTQTLAAIRSEVGRPVRAVVVSDGTRRALQPLLDLENVTFVRPGAAISDLLVLSKARVLLAPGASSFAAWASFLGQMPSVSHPGQPLSVWRLRNTSGQFLGEINPDGPDREFLQQVRGVLAEER